MHSVGLLCEVGMVAVALVRALSYSRHPALQTRGDAGTFRKTILLTLLSCLFSVMTCWVSIAGIGELLAHLRHLSHSRAVRMSASSLRRASHSRPVRASISSAHKAGARLLRVPPSGGVRWSAQARGAAEGARRRGQGAAVW